MVIKHIVIVSILRIMQNYNIYFNNSHDGTKKIFSQGLLFVFSCTTLFDKIFLQAEICLTSKTK